MNKEIRSLVRQIARQSDDRSDQQYDRSINELTYELYIHVETYLYLKNGPSLIPKEGEE